MKLIVPKKEVEVCDNCHRETYLVTCAFCRGRFCLSCGKAIIAGCAHQVPVCKKCGENKTVLEIVDEHAFYIQAAIDKRNDVIKEAAQQSVNPTYGNRAQK